VRRGAGEGVDSRVAEAMVDSVDPREEEAITDEEVEGAVACVV
jgi:hypothetical protein